MKKIVYLTLFNLLFLFAFYGIVMALGRWSESPDLIEQKDAFEKIEVISSQTPEVRSALDNKGAFAAISSQPSGIEWGRYYGGDQRDTASDWSTTNDGGYIFAAVTESFGVTNKTIFVTKTDATGVVVWAKIYGQTFDWYAHSIQQTTDNGFIIAGSYHNQSSANVMTEYGAFLLKLDANGNAEWNKIFNGGPFSSSLEVKQFLDGYAIVCGLDKDLFIFATDANGNLAWSRILDGSSANDYHSARIEVDNQNGSVTVFGQYQYDDGSTYTRYRLTIYTVSSSGVSSLEATHQGAFQSLNDSIKTADGGYALVGRSGTTLSSIFMKLDQQFGISWTRQYEPTPDDLYSIPPTHDTYDLNSIEQTSDGYIMSGAYRQVNTGNSSNIRLLKLNTDGTVNWEVIHSIQHRDDANFAHATADGGYVVGGITDAFTFGSRPMIFLMKLQ